VYVSVVDISFFAFYKLILLLIKWEITKLVISNGKYNSVCVHTFVCLCVCMCARVWELMVCVAVVCVCVFVVFLLHVCVCVCVYVWCVCVCNCVGVCWFECLCCV
jgi:hypothetical protein